DLGHHPEVLLDRTLRGRAMGGMPGHEQGDDEERDGEPLGALRQEVGRAARAEHGGGRAAPEAGAGLGARAALHEDQRDHGDREQHVHDIEDQDEHQVKLLAMARKSAATSEAPPINPPSTSGLENSAAALSGLQLPPYRIGSEPAILASRAATSPRMKACTSCACSGVATRPVPMAQTGS